MTHEGPEITDDPKAVEKIRALMEDIDVAMVTTVGHEHGRLESRPLSTQVADDGDALFLVRTDSAVAADVRADPRVNLGYTKSTAWLSVAGTASVTNDAELVARLWGKGAEAFMDGGPEDPGNAVLRVRGETAHLWGGGGVLELATTMLKAVAGRSGEDDSSTIVQLDGDG
jgi:general stress protein 26